MTFRVRVALALGLAAIVPLLVLGYGVRREMTHRLVTQADSQVQLQVQRARDRLAAESRAIDGRLDRLVLALEDNNQFRLVAVSGETAPWLLDWAPAAMRQVELDQLELVDSAGTILSSGHFRNQFGRSHRGLAELIVAESAQPVLWRARSATGQVNGLARARGFTLAGRRFALVGGMTLDLARLVPAAGADLTPRLLAGSPSGDDEALARIPLRLVTGEDSVVSSPAAIVLARDPGPLRALRRSVDRWFIGAIGVVILVATALAFWLSSRVTRPLADLAAKTAQVDLDRLDQTFATGRPDEIGALARLLDAMTDRLRASALRLREAERRAATGDLARQINHDVKNGLAPIRHVLRHLNQVAAETPGDLPAIYRERVGTLESSVAYLENLSRNYARLSPAVDRSDSDLNALVREIARALVSPRPALLRLGGDVLPVRADAVALRRIVENLAANAADAARDTGGDVTLASSSVSRDGTAWVRLEVADTGPGMSREQLERAFDDFFTTKPDGTGLGLSVVRRLVADLGGTLKVETAPGKGSRFIVDLPAGDRS